MSEGGTGRRYDRSFADLMAGVAVVFLILAVIFILEATKQRNDAETERAQAVLDRRDAVEAREKLEQRVHGQKEDVARTLTILHDELYELDGRFDGGFLALSDLADGGVNALEIEFVNFNFDLGRCATPRRQLPSLRAGAPSLVERICAAVGAIADAGAKPSIILEGHTDDRPFNVVMAECGVTNVSSGLEFDNNVRASAARAQSVFFSIRQTLADAGSPLGCLDDNFVVAGRGQAAPKMGLSPSDPRNRRLVIRVRGDLSL